MESIVLSGRDLIADFSRIIGRQITARTSSDHITKARVDEWIARRIGVSSNAYDTLARQAAYNFILKAIIFETIRNRFGFEQVRAGSMSDYLSSCRLAHDRTRWDAFRPNLLDDLLEGCNHQSSMLLERILRPLASVGSQKVDYIGRLYEDLIPQEDRRRLGEFYTPGPIAKFMTRWVIDARERTVLDPACGSGGFLVEALHRFSELGLSPAESVSRAHGIDINPLAVTMATANLVLRVPDGEPQVRELDFMRTPTDGEETSIVCNPPYTRHHELSAEYKEEIGSIISQESGRRTSRLASLYVHFFTHALSRLPRNGRLAFITPNDFLDVNYGIEFKEFLLKRFRIRAIILFEESSLVFREAQTTACITFVESGPPDDDTVFIKLHEWPTSPNELIDVVEGKVDSLSRGKVRRIRSDSLNPRLKWSRLEEPLPPRYSLLIPLRSLARAKRGIATGANDYFVLSDRAVKTWGIENQFLKPIVTNARFVPDLDFTPEDFQRIRTQGAKVWLLDVPAYREELDGGMRRYLEWGERRGINKGYLTRTRDLWYLQEQRAPPPIIFPLMVRQRPRFVYNKTNALITNNLHGVYPIAKSLEDPIRIKALLGYLNSSIALQSLPYVGRTYGGGLLKLEPREVESVPVPNMEEIPTGVQRRIAKSFDGLCEAERGKTADIARRELDHVVREIIS